VDHRRGNQVNLKNRKQVWEIIELQEGEKDDDDDHQKRKKERNKREGRTHIVRPTRRNFRTKLQPTVNKKPSASIHFKERKKITSN
jgi:hypothetical protein